MRKIYYNLDTSFTAVSWESRIPGDVVFIGGKLKPYNQNGKPTAVFGPHQIVDIVERTLCNQLGRVFFERSKELFIKTKKEK